MREAKAAPLLKASGWFWLFRAMVAPDAGNHMNNCFEIHRWLFASMTMVHAHIFCIALK